MGKQAINEFSQLYRRTRKGIGVTGSVVRIQSSRIKPRIIRVLSHVTVENITSGFTICRLGINNGGNDHFLDEIQTVAANELIVSRSDIILGEGDVFFAEFTGTTNGDTLRMTYVGWENNL